MKHRAPIVEKKPIERTLLMRLPLMGFAILVGCGGAEGWGVVLEDGETADAMKLPTEKVAHLQRYLQVAGFLPSAPQARIETFTVGILDDPTSRALKAFQIHFGLRPTGQLDNETSELTSRLRCGVPDVHLLGVWQKPVKWDKTDLTYEYSEITNDLLPAKVRELIEKAFKTWADVTSLRFFHNANADIVIRFVARDHGDKDAFDGPDNVVLAHAFYPPPKGGGFAGDVHFDDDELWTSAPKSLSENCKAWSIRHDKLRA